MRKILTFTFFLFFLNSLTFSEKSEFDKKTEKEIQKYIDEKVEKAIKEKLEKLEKQGGKTKEIKEEVKEEKEYKEIKEINKTFGEFEVPEDTVVLGDVNSVFSSGKIYGKVKGELNLVFSSVFLGERSEVDGDINAVFSSVFLIAGIASLVIFGLIPFFGPLLWTAITILGLGSVVLTKFGTKTA